MIKYIEDMNENDNDVIKNYVLVSGQEIVLVSDKKLSTREIMNFIGCGAGEIWNIYYEFFKYDKEDIPVFIIDFGIFIIHIMKSSVDKAIKEAKKFYPTRKIVDISIQ